MSSTDFTLWLVAFMVAFIVCVGGCDHVLLSLVNDDEMALRKKVNELELRIWRIELKSKGAK